MRSFFRIFLLHVMVFGITFSKAQLVVTPETNGVALVQKLVGNGVSVSNITLTFTNPAATGFFNNISGTNIGIDSGIILTNGRVQSDFRPTAKIGVDGNGTFFAADNTKKASTTLGLAGDADLANSLGSSISNLHDAVILEFDFVPLGDTVKFNYILGSEEYTVGTVCTFNDAFAFYISGPGITGKQNMALVPGTNLPVSIKNVNNVVGGACPNNIAYYVDNGRNTLFTYEGHTTVLTASSAVQPCQTYHLKLVIADYGDFVWDSGVFIEAKSLSSNAITINNITQTDPVGNSYLVEGCSAGSFKIKRPFPTPTPLPVTLSYGGTALNNIDVQSLPTLIIIPANDTVVTINVIPIIDNIPEGIEELKVYALSGCANRTPTDSTTIQIRDYDILGIMPDSLGICNGTTIQLVATSGYATYQWNADPTISNAGIRDPFVTPVNNNTTYICTAQEGTCSAKDSAFIKIKKLNLVAKQNIHCNNGTTGQIKTTAGWGWSYPVEFSFNGGAYQPDSNFNNLPVGNYKIVIRDASSCKDSITVTLVQTHPDLVITNIATTPAGCSGLADGTITATAVGGLSPYLYSIDGVNYQSLNNFNVSSGNYPVKIVDVNSCEVSQNTFVPFYDSITVDAGNGSTICEGKTTTLSGASNAAGVVWSPAADLTTPTALTTIAKPSVTTQFYLIATTGLCVHTDSVIVYVNPAPIPNAGADIVTCYGYTTKLNGSGGTEFYWGPSSFLNNAHIAKPVSTTPASFTYYLWVKDAIGCEALKSDSVNVKIIPQVKIFAGNDTTVSIMQPLQLKAIETSNSGITQYTWSPSFGLNNGFIYNPVAILNNDITYHVTGTTPDGCYAIDDIKVRVIKGPDIYVPTAFTPNGDGYNDVLRPIPVGIKQFNYFKVFNRLGQLVFQTSNPTQGWDGKIKGILQVNTAFVWMAEAVDYKGNLIQRKGSTIGL